MGEKVQALDRARALNARNPDDAAALAVLAAAQLANADFNGALATNERLLNSAPSAPVAMAAAQLRMQTGKENAFEPIEQWLEKHPRDVAARMMLAQMAQQRNLLDKAASQYEQVVAQQPQDAIALNNLAWVQHQRSNPKALATAMRAHELAPANPFIADTYGWLLAESGKVKAALPLLRDAARRDPTRASIRYHLAATLARSASDEDRKTARLYLADLLRDPAPEDWRGDAEKLLSSLGEV
jgi:tetratricopeptide (TPR) repeat protein